MHFLICFFQDTNTLTEGSFTMHFDFTFLNYHCKLHEKRIPKDKQTNRQTGTNHKRKRVSGTEEISYQVGRLKTGQDCVCVGCSFKSGETRKFVPQVVKPCSPHFPLTHDFYLLYVGRVSVSYQ